jgi:hypothetical protein
MIPISPGARSPFLTVLDNWRWFLGRGAPTPDGENLKISDEEALDMLEYIE